MLFYFIFFFFKPELFFALQVSIRVALKFILQHHVSFFIFDSRLHFSPKRFPRVPDIEY